MSPLLFVILVTFSSTFTYIFQAHTLFSTHPSKCYIPLKHWLDTQSENKSSAYPFNQVVIFSYRNPPQKYCIANRPTMLYLDSKTTKYLNNHLSHSNNPHVSHTVQNRDMRIQCLIFVHQSWMVKWSHPALEFSQSN